MKEPTSRWEKVFKRILKKWGSGLQNPAEKWEESPARRGLWFSTGCGKEVGILFLLGGFGRKALRGFPTFYLLSSADGAQEAFPARPLVNHPPFKVETVVNDMVSPLKIPFPAGCRRKCGFSDRSEASKERSLMKRVQSKVFITAKPRASGIRLVWTKFSSPSASCTSVPSAFLREEGGARSVTEGACGTISLYYMWRFALSLTRFHRELPPGGSRVRETGRLFPRRMNCRALIPISPLLSPAGVFRVSAAPENLVNALLGL